MLGLLLIYFIGKRFYDLSEQYGKNKWMYAILSVVTFYGSMFVFGLLLGLLDLLFGWGVDWDKNSIMINLLGIPIGLLAVWIFYTLLEKNWKKAVAPIKDEINMIGRTEEKN